MAKQPYIPFYVGDYIKDTRRLPLAVRGAWVDLLLFMWDEPVRGEIIGTMEEFSGILSCSQKDCEFVVNLLIEKKVCDHEKLSGGKIKIISRRMKKEADISIKRSLSGKRSAEERSKSQQNSSKYSTNDSAKNKQNTEYEYEVDNEDEIGIKKGGVGENWNPKPSTDEMGLELDSVKAGAVIELFKFSKNHDLTKKELDGLWSVFKAQNFTGEKFYESKNKVYSHFINWSKTQNINGTSRIKSSPSKPVAEIQPSGGFGKL